jgi:methyl-accepting chemotaxis protein
MNDQIKNDASGANDDFHDIDELANQVKVLALNLAISLAKAKNEAKELVFLEPDFTKLINGSIEVIKEISSILKTYRNEDKLVYSPPSQSDKLDRIETSLGEIYSLSQSVLKTIGDIKKRKGKVDNYR